MKQEKEFLTPEKKREIEQLPLSEHLCVRIKYANTYEILKQQAEKNPDKTALIAVKDLKNFSDEKLSYAELFAKVNQTAAAFIKLGVKNTDSISFILPNIFETYFCMLAAEAVAVANPICPEFPPEVIVSLLSQAKSKLVMLPSPQGFDEKDPMKKQFQALLEAIEKANATRALDCQILLLGPPDKQHLNFHALIEREPKKAISCHKRHQDACIIFHTSSSTSLMPKLVRFSQLARLQMIWSLKTCFDMAAHDNFLNGLPLFHVGAATLYTGAAFAAGACGVLMSPLGWKDQAAFKNTWKLIEHYRITSFTAIPPVYMALDKDLPVDANLDSLQYVISGWPAPLETYQSLEQKMKAQIINIYGMTESGCILTMHIPGRGGEYGSLGYALPYQELNIADLSAAQAGKMQPLTDPHQLGMLCAKGINFGHYLNPETEQQAYCKQDWFKTGDMGYFDDKDNYYLKCRHYDYFERQGRPLSCFEIENKIDLHEAVQLAAVLHKPDAIEGQVPMLYAEIKPGYVLTEASLLNWIKAREDFSAQEIPKAIIFTQLPVNGMGKVIKPLLYQAMHAQLEQEKMDV